MLVPYVNGVGSCGHVTNCDAPLFIGDPKVGRIDSQNYGPHMRVNRAEKVSNTGTIEFQPFAPVEVVNNRMKKVAIGERKRLMHPAITITEFDGATCGDYE